LITWYDIPHFTVLLTLQLGVTELDPDSTMLSLVQVFEAEAFVLWQILSFHKYARIGVHLFLTALLHLVDPFGRLFLQFFDVFTYLRSHVHRFLNLK